MDLRKFQALAGVQLCTMLFGLSAVLAKGLPLPVSAIVAGRAAWAVVTLSAVLLLARRQWRRLSWRELSQLSINGLLLAGHWICFFTGVEQGGVAVGTLGFACFPLFVALIGRVIFATPITRRDVAAMVMVAVGLVVISPEALSAQGGGTALLWALAAGLSYAVIVLYNRHAKTGASPLQSAWLQCCACALATLPWGYSAIRSADGETLLHVILIGVHRYRLQPVDLCAAIRRRRQSGDRNSAGAAVGGFLCRHLVWLAAGAGRFYRRRIDYCGGCVLRVTVVNGGAPLTAPARVG